LWRLNELAMPNRINDYQVGRQISRVDAGRQFNFAVAALGVLVGVALATALTGYYGSKAKLEVSGLRVANNEVQTIRR
jgi:hypothetical protein